ncbi:AAA family ATPase [Burkholderia pseudomallei]|uniref:AAA family ATPase n=1 Tax=Burkholderia pseudomallei TaxID=28450 RepID=UPI000E69EB69|nr:AAA family ATPase [Burkholderia pseudomallei]RIV56205.1 helicase [Burkholderia pseudomallei]RIV66313.1 helicase [Burkholderia pseudomallei]
MTDDPLRARSALFCLDAGCERDEWVRIGMAYKASGGDTETWVEWCATGANYGGEHDARSVWKSIDIAGGIGPGTLFRIAQQAGWQDDQARTHHNGVQMACAPRSRNGIRGPQQAIEKPARDLTATFENYPPADANHPYIVAKRGNAEGLRAVPGDDPLIIRGHRVAGWLAVPVRTLDGILTTLQYIPPPGVTDKLNAPGGKFGTGMHLIGDILPDGRIYVCEGIGQAWSCARADYQAAAVVTFGSGRLRIVTQALRARYPGAHVVLVADRGKEMDCEAVARQVGGAWVQLPADKPANYDANDFERDHGTEALERLLNAPSMPPMRYLLQTGDELMNAPPLGYLIEHVLPKEGVAALFGPTGCGKSFLALDLCAAIAAGTSEWFGQRVTAAPVTYCALEGERGIGKRLKAWTTHHGERLPTTLRFVTQPLDLRNACDVDDLATAILAVGGGAGLLVIDTLNRAAPGADENASADMGALIEACQELQRRLGGTVMLVHHTGKDGTKGLRGHSSLHAALDAAIEVSRSESRRDWTVIKSKDDADGQHHAFALRMVVLDGDERGEPVTSCVVESEIIERTTRRVPTPQGANQALAYKAIGALLRTSKHFGKSGAPAGRPCVELEAAFNAAAECMTCAEESRRYVARRAVTVMAAKGIYEVKGGWLWHA